MKRPQVETIREIAQTNGTVSHGTITALCDYLLVLESALIEIRDQRLPQVCQEFELCTHEGCRASYEAFAIADQAVRKAA